jgi:small subunit ribosomal protein S6
MEYELVFLSNPDLEDDVFDEIVERAEGIIGDDSGTVFLRDHWGRKRTAYDIGGFSKAHYTLMVFAAEATVVAKLERVLRLDERVLRYMTVRTSERVDVDARVAWGRALEETLRKEREERARIEAERAAERAREEALRDSEPVDAEELGLPQSARRSGANAPSEEAPAAAAKSAEPAAASGDGGADSEAVKDDAGAASDAEPAPAPEGDAAASSDAKDE